MGKLELKKVIALISIQDEPEVNRHPKYLVDGLRKLLKDSQVRQLVKELLVDMQAKEEERISKPETEAFLLFREEEAARASKVHQELLGIARRYWRVVKSGEVNIGHEPGQHCNNDSFIATHMSALPLSVLFKHQAALRLWCECERLDPDQNFPAALALPSGGLLAELRERNHRAK